MSNEYCVVVGNIGTVYRGIDHDVACRVYWSYVSDSENGHGRAAWQDVSLYHPDGTLLQEHRGQNQLDDHE